MEDYSDEKMENVWMDAMSENWRDDRIENYRTKKDWIVDRLEMERWRRIRWMTK